MKKENKYPSIKNTGQTDKEFLESLKHITFTYIFPTDVKYEYTEDGLRVTVPVKESIIIYDDYIIPEELISENKIDRPRCICTESGLIYNTICQALY